MSLYDCQYQDVLKDILNRGYDCPDRTGVGVRKVFDVNISIDLSTNNDSFKLPALTLRKVFPRVAFEELFWMLSGSTDANVLKEKNIHIWDGNTSREFLDSRGLEYLQEGQGGKIYGHQFRKFNGYFDQLRSITNSLINEPHSRRHFISLWNPCDAQDSALMPCHSQYQFVVTGDKLNLKFYQRSADFILGAPMNMMFSAFFLTFMSNITGYKVGKLAHSIGDCHIYENHLDVAEELAGLECLTPMAKFKWKCPDQIESSDQIDNAIESMSWNGVEVQYDSYPKIDRDRLIMAV